MHVCRTIGKLRSQNLKNGPNKPGKKDRKRKRKGQERKVGVIKRVKLVTDYLAVFDYVQ